MNEKKRKIDPWRLDSPERKKKDKSKAIELATTTALSEFWLASLVRPDDERCGLAPAEQLPHIDRRLKSCVCAQQTSRETLNQ